MEHFPDLDLIILREEEVEGEAEGGPTPIFPKAKGVWEAEATTVNVPPPIGGTCEGVSTSVAPTEP